MVVMLDGTETELGSQVAPALFGYLIGMACAVGSFAFGQHVGEWFRVRHHQPQPVSVVEEEIISEIHKPVAAENRKEAKPLPDNLWHHVLAILRLPISVLLLAVGVEAAFVIADAFEISLFYRKMWMTVILAPVGALLRWYLSELNFRKVRGGRLGWVPWGTLLANLLACMVSVTAEAIDSRFLDKEDSGYSWLSPLMRALETGFAGCLSTVATMLREMFLMDKAAEAHAYWSFTVVCGMLISLTIYGPMVRSR
jgi:fluoride ion exporter CrcB/FEX